MIQYNANTIHTSTVNRYAVRASLWDRVTDMPERERVWTGKQIWTRDSCFHQTSCCCSRFLPKTLRMSLFACLFVFCPFPVSTSNQSRSKLKVFYLKACMQHHAAFRHTLHVQAEQSKSAEYEPRWFAKLGLVASFVLFRDRSASLLRFLQHSKSLWGFCVLWVFGLRPLLEPEEDEQESWLILEQLPWLQLLQLQRHPGTKHAPRVVWLKYYIFRDWKGSASCAYLRFRMS